MQKNKHQNQAAILSTTPNLPVTHPCYNCPIAKIYGDTIFCFTPSCLREVFNNRGKSCVQEA